MSGLQQQSGIELEDESATIAFGESLAKELGQRLSEGGVVFLHGDLGAGKTTLARGILRGMGYLGTVRSPTYTLVEHYPTQPLASAHFDLYRLGHPEELEFIGARDELMEGNLCLIEWPERAMGCLGVPDVDIYLRFNHFKKDSQVTKNTRQIDIQWHNASHGQ
jgi:tRNA threonylcarbamoyladenosine biosynthesis protein TsaE